MTIRYTTDTIGKDGRHQRKQKSFANLQDALDFIGRKGIARWSFVRK